MRVTSVAMPFAGLMHRFLAACIDGFFVLLVAILAAAIVGPGVPLRGIALSASAFVFAVACLGVLPGTRIQGTPGKHATGLKITGMDGKPIGIGRSLARFALSLATIATLGLGFLLAGWNGKRQALHDLGAGTLVVQKTSPAEEIAGATAPPMGWMNRVLGIVFLPCLLVAAYSPFSVYFDMRKRSQVAGAIYATIPLRKDVEKALLEGTPMPSPPAALAPDTRSLSVQPDGKVTLGIADQLYPGGRIHFTPVRTEKGIEWKCRSENIRTHLGATCRE